MGLNKTWQACLHTSYHNVSNVPLDLGDFQGQFGAATWKTLAPNSALSAMPRDFWEAGAGGTHSDFLGAAEEGGDPATETSFPLSNLDQVNGTVSLLRLKRGAHDALRQRI